MNKNILTVTVINQLYKSESSQLYFNIYNGSAHVKNTFGDKLYSLEPAKTIQEITIPQYINYQDTLYPVTSIQASAFLFCKQLTRVSLPDTLTTIEYNAFGNCTSLTDIALPPSLIKIANNAFENCTSLQHINLPPALQSIGDSAFAHTAITFTNQSPHFLIENGCLYTADKSQLIYAYKNLTGTFTLPQSVAVIGGSAFEDCKLLTQIILPSTLKQIHDSAFENCTALSDIQIPEGVKSIGKYTFFECDAITHIVLPHTIKFIDSYAFGWCYNLQEIWIKNRACEYTKADIPTDTAIYIGLRKQRIA